MSDYPKGEGALWKNAEKTMEKHPDYRGHVILTADQIRMLVSMNKANKEMKLQIGMWRRKSKAGQPYCYLSTETYFKEERQEAPPPTDDFEDNKFVDDDIPFN